ncbi:MAG: HDIG domain-containing protein [Clostridiales bacterium]|nr:HDIG domain-containing protein [Clostridiales bacterium]
MNNGFWLRFQQIIVVFLMTAIAVAIVYYGYRPPSYDLNVGSVCDRDIYAQRTFVDSFQTEYQAVTAKNNAGSVFIRSEDLSEQNIDNVEKFFKVTDEARRNILTELGSIKPDLTEEAAAYKDMLNEEMGLVLDDQTIDTLISMPGKNYVYFKEKAVSTADIIMKDNLDQSSLLNSINDQVNVFGQSNPSLGVEYSDSLRAILRATMTPNTILDENATKDAGDNAYTAAMNDPVIIEKGTKIIGAGEIVTEHTYSNLQDLELIRDDSFDILIFVRVMIYVVMVIFIASWYIVSSRHALLNNMRGIYTVVIAFFIPLALSIFLRSYSSFIVVILFFTTIVATYIGISTGIILSIAELFIMWPVMNFDIGFMIVSTVGVVVCAVIAGNRNRKYNSASVIILPSLFCVGASAAYTFILGGNNMSFLDPIIWTLITSVFSIVMAIGLIPIYELLSNVVSPVTLIELSQPGHPLLKRLFIEASGTYHHSIMVSNLADAAAEAIGADALLCKVASYYHDIGKLENPMYFTENQSEGYNPHDDLSVEESVNILTAHPEDGVKLAKKYKLPEPVIKIIDEHHGTTYPGFFYNKACRIAQENGYENPDVSLFRYRGHIPSSQESAVIMIADTCEAAVRSKGIQDLDEIESLIRTLIKDKIDQDQLINSGLSFEDIEKIINAFRLIYAGVFHERIKY